MSWRLLHIFLWLTGYLLLNLSDGTIGTFTAGMKGYWLASLYGTFFNILLFYIHADYLLPKLQNRKHWYIYLFSTIGLLLTLSTIESYIDFVFIQYYPITYASTFIELWKENMLIHTFFILLLSFGYRFSKDWFKNEQQKQKLKEEKLAAELSFLKAQINPHFLFNTLNNLFASAKQNQDFQTASGIAKLAKMMRYMLEEAETTLVSIEAEISYLKNYIDLQKMRFSEEDDIDIELKESGNWGEQMIAPLLLIPFVENAFKHGISLRSKSYIYIDIRVEDQFLHFQIQNSNHNNVSFQSNHSIGLQNVQERLQLIYPKQHQLIIETDKKVFDVQLRIKLS